MRIAAAVSVVVAGAGLAAAPHASAAGLSPVPVTAFQANGSGDLWFDGSKGYFDTGLAMAPGTSPSITAVNSGYEIAYQSSSHLLGYTGIAGSALTGLAMDPASSPSITTTASFNFGPENFQIAFESSTDVLGTTGVFGTESLGLDMAPGTSPSTSGLLTLGLIPGNPFFTAVDIGYHIDFHASTGTLCTYDFNGSWLGGIYTSNGNTGYGMAAGASPSTSGS